VESAVVPEAREIELQGFRFEQPFARRVVDDENCEIRLAGDRTDGGELGAGEAGDVIGVRVRVRYAIEHGLLGRGGQLRGLAEQKRLAGQGAGVVIGALCGLQRRSASVAPLQGENEAPIELRLVRRSLFSS
jgi:hypothetical protein